MSTKSQKSITDALSEIFERSYTLKSISNETLSDIDEDDTPSYELLNKLDAPAISKLRKYFKKRRKSETNHGISELDRKILQYMKTSAVEEGISFDDPTTVPPCKVLWIDKETLTNAVENILGSSKYSSNCSKLFSMLDPFRTGRIWWNDFLDKMVEFGTKKTRSRCDKWVPINVESITVKDMAHCKKDTIAKIVPIQTRKSFCYVVISKSGKCGIYDGSMHLLSEYDIFYAKTKIQRRIKTIWVTDAKYMEDTKTLIIAASNRSLTFYEVSTVCHIPLYLISGAPNIPTCISYEPSLCKEDESHLFFGDDHGCITTLTFRRPRFGLLYKKHHDKINEYFWMELQSSPHDNFCFTNTVKNVHRRSVRRIYYCRHNDLIISCSNDPESSIVIRHRMGRRDPYVFKVLRGVLCFHLSTNLRILATGSSDGVVRLWDPVVTSQPFAVLTGHSKPIVDLAVIAHLDIVISYDKKGILNIWDINEEQLLQSIQVDFPFMKILGKSVEFGTFALYPGPARTSDSMDTRTTTPIRLVADSMNGQRESKVFINEDGVLKLESESDCLQTGHNTVGDILEKDPEHILWNKIDFLVTCCSYIATLKYNPYMSPTRYEGSDMGSDRSLTLLPPPERMSRPRKPSIWNDYDSDSTVAAPELLSGNSIRVVSRCAGSTSDMPSKAPTGETQSLDAGIKPQRRGNISGLPSSFINLDSELTIQQNNQAIETAERIIVNKREDLNSLAIRVTASNPVEEVEDSSLDELLKKAGLSNILEKDFVKMMGLKHDLNTRMAELKLKQIKMKASVSQCAPYMALDIHELSNIQFLHPLPISERMKKRSKLNEFSSTEQLLKHDSCFSMTTPRTSNCCSSSRTDATRSNSNASSVDRRIKK